jgi:AcrR family transcriptional regulator
MSKKSFDTKSKIVTAAWRLFYENGYEATTVDDIISLSGTSRGSFYHYFEGKDALLGSIADLFDKEYIRLSAELSPDKNRFEALMWLNFSLFSMIENSIDFSLLTLMYSTQLTTKGEKTLLNHNRVYYKTIRKLVVEGQERGEISTEFSPAEIVKVYAMCERALLYDWCLVEGEYSLCEYAKKMMPILLSAYKTNK